jgi:hypothetical protein
VIVAFPVKYSDGPSTVFRSAFRSIRIVCLLGMAALWAALLTTAAHRHDPTARAQVPFLTMS